MKQANSYRLLKLMEIFREETDEYNELDVYSLRKKLMHVLAVDKLDVRTIKQDILALEEIGFDIVKNRKRHGKIYYSHQSRSFETYQLRLLVDAVLSAKFITISEKVKIIDQIKQLTSKYIGESLPEPIAFNQTVNIDYDMIKHNIDRVHIAIAERKEIEFKYGNYNVLKEFTYRKDGQLYRIAPYGLIWQDDFYYVIGYSDEHETIRHYRVDRMRHIEITQSRFKMDDTFDLQAYTSKLVNMFTGEDETILVRFSNDLINVVLDNFGLDATIEADGDDHFILKRRTKISDGLKSWLLGWGSKVKVIAPEKLVDDMKDLIEEMAQIYAEK